MATNARYKAVHLSIDEIFDCEGVDDPLLLYQYELIQTLLPVSGTVGIADLAEELVETSKMDFGGFFSSQPTKLKT